MSTATAKQPAEPGHSTKIARDIVERTASFADRIIKLTRALPNNAAGWEIGRQIVRDGMSVGANVEEAQAGESRSDFHKMKIERKECHEARFFVKRIANAELIPKKRLDGVLEESDQLLRILTSIIRNSGG